MPDLQDITNYFSNLCVPVIFLTFLFGISVCYAKLEKRISTSLEWIKKPLYVLLVIFIIFAPYMICPDIKVKPYMGDPEGNYDNLDRLQ